MPSILLSILIMLALACNPSPKDQGLAYRDPGTGIAFPRTLASLEFQELKKFDPKAGVGLKYQGPDEIIGRIFIYSDGQKNLGHGISSPAVLSNFEEAKGAVYAGEKEGRYKGVTKIKEGTTSITTAGGNLPMLEITLGLIVHPEAIYNRPLRYHILLTAYRDSFLKIIFTYLEDQKEQGEKALALFLTDLGKNLTYSAALLDKTPPKPDESRALMQVNPVPVAERKFLLGLKLGAGGNYDDGKEAFDQAVAEGLPTKDCLKIINDVKAERIKDQAARQMFKGIEFYLNKRYLKGVGEFDQVIKSNPRYEIAYVWRAGSYIMNNQFSPALSDYIRALEINPQSAEAYHGLGFIFSRQGQLEQAIKEYTKALEIAPTAKIYNDRGYEYFLKKEYDKAIIDFSKALEIDPKLVKVYINRADAYRFKGEYDRAIADCDLGLKIAPNHPGLLWEKAASYDLAGQNEEALKFFHEFIKYAGPEEQNYVGKVRERIEQLRAKPNDKRPSDSESHIIKGLANFREGLLDKAIEDFTQAIKINPNSAVAYNDRGLTYLKKKLYDQAISDFTQAMTINPQFANLYNNRALTYHILGQYEKAWADVHKAESLGLKLNPKFLENLKKSSGRKEGEKPLPEIIRGTKRQ